MIAAAENRWNMRTLDDVDVQTRKFLELLFICLFTLQPLGWFEFELLFPLLFLVYLICAPFG